MLVKTKVKYIQTLGQKKFRQEETVFIAEGPKLLAEFLSSGALIKEVYAIKEWIDRNDQVTRNVETTEVSMQELKSISQLSTPNQVLAIVQQFAVPEIIAKGTITLVLDTIQDPGNLGTIIRIADWFGIQQIVCSHDSADLYNPKVVQATMGSIARVKLLYADLVEWLNDHKQAPAYATTLNGTDITTMGKIKEGIIFIGNESRGLRAELLELADKKITIPGKGNAESLNAAVATGIILSHLV